MREFDVAILGSSFSGSLLAWILASQGMRVLLLDRGKHPRFAIGESSTPTADFLLETIAKRWSLTDLLPLARWGSWQATYPQLTAGKKRGFSYFAHQPHEIFRDTDEQQNSLLVAASENDEVSDTHWFRADVDQFLFEKARQAQVETAEECREIQLQPTSHRWMLTWHQQAKPKHSSSAQAKWLIDATGAGGAIAQAVSLTPIGDSLRTKTGALFSHFRNVKSWDEMQSELNNLSTITPFCSDDAAQHHLLADGWMWVLRFNNGSTSVGILKPTSSWNNKEVTNQVTLENMWREELSTYPSLARMLDNAVAIQPFQFHRQLSRLWSRASGERWAMLPTTAGFIDPLHSSGIAHALSGVYRVAEMLLSGDNCDSQWKQYGVDVVDEVRWIDCLVDACYSAMPDFELFCQAANFYFISAIDAEHDFGLYLAEKHSAQSTTVPSFLSSQKAPLRSAILECITDLKSVRAQTGALGFDHQTKQIALERIAQRLRPWNVAGLGNPEAKNRYAKTAAPK
jgi:tetracycline 7-halogenase / FADH2 O2-dependent halogenase